MRLPRLPGAILLLTVVLAAQARNERESTVGMRARIDELVLPGTELAVGPTTHESPVVVRITAVRAHGEDFRYDLEWTGLEAGTHDLKDYLIRKDGSGVDDLPAIEVTVGATLDPEETEPSDPEPVRPPDVSGYSTQFVVATVIWIVGLLAILFVGRKRRQPATAPDAPPTLADRLRPFVEAAATGKASDAEKAELERLLVAFWRERLGLQELKADRAIVAIRSHEEAGELLRQLEAWLHMPHPPQEIDLPALLEPYRHVPASSVGPSTGGAR